MAKNPEDGKIEKSEIALFTIAWVRIEQIKGNSVDRGSKFDGMEVQVIFFRQEPDVIYTLTSKVFTGCPYFKPLLTHFQKCPFTILAL